MGSSISQRKTVASNVLLFRQFARGSCDCCAPHAKDGLPLHRPQFSRSEDSFRATFRSQFEDTLRSLRRPLVSFCSRLFSSSRPCCGAWRAARRTDLGTSRRRGSRTARRFLSCPARTRERQTTGILFHYVAARSTASSILY